MNARQQHSRPVAGPAPGPKGRPGVWRAPWLLGLMLAGCLSTDGSSAGLCRGGPCDKEVDPPTLIEGGGVADLGVADGPLPADGAAGDAAAALAPLTVTVGVNGLCGPNRYGKIVSAPPGIDCGAPDATRCTAAFPVGTRVTLTSVPLPGARFDRWSAGCSGVAPSCAIDLMGATTVIGSFAGVHGLVLTVGNPGGGGYVAVSPPGFAPSYTMPGWTCGGNPLVQCCALYEPGTEVTLTARPAGNVRFDGWEGACTGLANPCKVTINGRVLVTARLPRSMVSREEAPPLVE